MNESQRNYLDPAALMRIKDLQLRAKAVADGFQNGIHRSPYHGFSAEFSEYRQYSPGDDPKFLDWRLFARTDRYYIKKFEDETNRRCYLLVDLSKSMQYSSIDYTKSDYARTLAATLAYFLANQRDSVGMLLFAEEILDYHEARFRPGHMGRLIAALDRTTEGQHTDLRKPLSQIARTVNRRGLVVLISDMLADIDSLQNDLGYLKSRGHDILVLRVLDPAEIDFPFEEANMMRDLETGRDMYVEPSQMRMQYKENFHAHEIQIREACERLGAEYTRILTNSPLETALFDVLRSQMQRGRKVQRRGRAGGRI
jgi:uncharacterized protein (DUF58 family)